MNKYLIIRILPTEPVSPIDFAASLVGLQIDAYEMSTAHPDGTLIGSASYAAPTPSSGAPNAVPPVPLQDPSNLIFQHYNINNVGNNMFSRDDYAVATAYIPIASVPSEYMQSDVFFKVTRGTGVIIQDQKYYNVPVYSLSSPINFNTLQSSPNVSLYLSLPPAGVQLNPASAFVTMPADGTPPNYEALFTAVQTVLTADPAGGVNLADLTIDKCRHIAYEISCNPNLSQLPSSASSLEDLYTLPDNSQKKQDRLSFKGDLEGYYAVQNAAADKLTQYVYAVSAAAWCERVTNNATQIFYRFPVTFGGSGETQVILQGVGSAALAPPFAVTANFFYALTADLPVQSDARLRFQASTRQNAAALIEKLTKAINGGIINAPAGTALTEWQAVRRMTTQYVFNDSTVPVFVLQAGSSEKTLIQHYLNFAAEDITPFWNGLNTADKKAHLNLMLAAFTRETQGTGALLTNAIIAAGVNSAAALNGWTEAQWRVLFDTAHGGMANMPIFISPGSLEERITAFMSYVRKFFDAAASYSVSPAPAAGEISGLARPAGNPLDMLIASPSGFTFAAWDGTQATIQAELNIVFPSDPAAQKQFTDWLHCIKAVFTLTEDILPNELQFSAMEALWARGITSKEIINKYSEAELQEALTGSVAYDFAHTIWVKAGSVTPEAPGDSAGFKPINPDGSLTNCIPPLNRSPLGPVAYLHDLLQVSADSDCENPIVLSAQNNLSTLLSGRRGLLGDLLGSKSNLEVPIPLIDIVNESLEFMAATGTDNGTVYNTANDSVGGHVLNSNPLPAPNVRQHDPEKLLEVLPEHSTPAAPTGSQHAYELLAKDFSSCDLPYSQALDINCTYLKSLCTSRYETMRRFRKNITEFVLDPSLETAEFQQHLWRYPVRIETAIGYFCMSGDEYKFFTGGGVTVTTPRASGKTKKKPVPNEEGKDPLYKYYGYLQEETEGPNGKKSWMTDVVKVSEFLERTCLTYCQFVELWKSEFVKFACGNNGKTENFPECEPCCLDNLTIVFPDGIDVAFSLYKLNLFIRLWRKLLTVKNAGYSFEQLHDICEVLVFFNGTSVNPDFIRQLVAFQIFRDNFNFSLTDGTVPAAGSTGAERMHILAFWAAGASKWDWAVQHLLDKIHHYAHGRFGCECREPEFIKLLFANLDKLSVLSGFEPDSIAGNHHWHEYATDTLRFSEILTKIYASKSTVGDLLFLFTADPHLDGDDPLQSQTANEASDSPFGLPDDEAPDSLWSLRKKMLAAEADQETASEWSWPKIENSLRNDFGMDTAAYSSLLSLGKHFFPNILSKSGIPLSSSDKRYAVNVPIGSTAPDMWNTPNNGPFGYDSASQELYSIIPLNQESVLAKLARVRQLNAAEQKAVRDLYFLPRTDLACFAFIFSNFGEAEEKLIQEPDEMVRWEWFQKEFAMCHARCTIIEEHITSHVLNITKQKDKEGSALAKVILKSLWGDENKAAASWENDNGISPNPAWNPMSTGGGYAAILGLIGTGMLAEYSIPAAGKIWREVRGGTDIFGQEENEWNAPLPTVLPAMNLAVPSDLSKFISFHNGFALANLNGDNVGGAQSYSLQWKGLVLIDHGGNYSFMAGAPTENGEVPNFDGIRSDHSWRVTLSRGQKTWIVLNHQCSHEEAPAHCSDHISLKKGMYELSIELNRNPFSFDDDEDVCRQLTGFQLKYKGPDSDEIPVTIPFNKLFQKYKDTTLNDGLNIGDEAGNYLNIRYTSTVRDIRSTYIRAYKALLFAVRLGLSAKRISDNGESELGYMLSNPSNFAGQSYYRTGGTYSTHKANFDFNFLPVGDNYFGHNPITDDRAAPSVKRQQAMFDWWERLFDYTIMRKEAKSAHEYSVWLLFHESKEQHTDDVFHLLRYMGVSVNHSAIVQLFNPNYELNGTGHPDDLNDDRWAVRAWKAEKWLRLLERAFYDKDIRSARPDLWASIDPNSIETFAAESGNANLTKFFRDGCIENNSPLRYEDIKQINDGLRLRGRNALVSYLTSMNRVTLPWGGFASNAKQLSELLLIDVETGLCQKASRIEEAVSALQLFIQRSRLGLESSFTATPNFIKVWEKHFTTFSTWESCKRHEIYRENWIEWDELETARKSETFQLLESKLREAALSIAAPGGLAFWNGIQPPSNSGVMLLQNREQEAMQVLNPAREGLGLMGTPDRYALPSLLAPLKTVSSGTQQDVIGSRNINAMPGSPLWLQAAVKLGTKFIRVAAANIPPGSLSAAPKCNSEENSACCCECGKVHPVLVDEYYFWIEESKYFEEQEQNADWGVTGSDKLSDWHRSKILPGLLNWNSKPKVLLRWCRVHNGEFQQPNQSYAGVRVNSFTAAELVLSGRVGDSLFFNVTGGLKPLPIDGYPDLPLPGFRYDIHPDEAITLPEVVPSKTPLTIGGLSAYPFFAYFNPGAPLLPPSMFSPVITVAGQLRTNCKFESALKWYEFFYNPLLNDNTWAECLEQEHNPAGEQTKGTHVSSAVPNTTVHSDTTMKPSTEVPPNSDVPPIKPQTEPKNDCCCPSNPIDDTKATHRIVVMQYLETLVQWGDALMRRNTPESFQQARLIFDTAHKITGDTPITVEKQTSVGTDNKVALFIPDCAPLNPRLVCIYGTLNDRLSLIHSCLNAKRLHNGKSNLDMPYFGNSKLRNCWKTADGGCSDEFDWCQPQSPYRFAFLMQKALEMASEVRGLGSALQSAYEKGDAEYLSSIRTMHERQLLNLAFEIRQQQWRESDWQVQSLKKTKENDILRRQYNADLIAAGLISGEIQYEALTQTALSFRLSANIAEGAAGIVGIIPDIYLGEPPLAHLPLGLKLAEATLLTIGRIMNALADRASTNANLELTEAGWARREAEWIFQVASLDIEIQQIERQILAAERRRSVALSELNNQQQQIENAAEIHDFLRDKFTNHALYLWQQQETAALYYQMYEMALHAARQAEQAFNLERGYTSKKFIPAEIWDNLHEGLLSGERLQLALRHMERSYFDENTREYELTKHISLRIHSPEQLLQLRETGYCEIELPEWLFDLDYPGHYMRRIKNVTMSIPCIVGPYTGIHCRLTLLSSKIRVNPKIDMEVHACCKDKGCDNGYETIPDDTRIVNIYTATEAIATSGGQNDSGMFELNFKDERYLPFEYKGTVSRWRIELPLENNFFDMSTVADIVFHLNFTAREGGDLLRKAANECAQHHVPGDGIRLFDVRQEMPDTWHLFQNSSKKCRELPLKLNTQMFPYLPDNRKLWLNGFDIFFESDGCSCKDGMTVEFIIDPEFLDCVQVENDEDGIEIHCVESIELPGLYHGHLSLKKLPITSGETKEYGHIEFPSDIAKVKNFYIAARYSSDCENKKKVCC